MKSVLEQLKSDEQWNDFLIEKENNEHISKNEKAMFRQFVEEKRYQNFVGSKLYNFSYPTKKLINKIGKTKKRVVYTFSKDESIILKFISHKLYKYDYIFPPNLYSFRHNYTVKNAIKKLTRKKNINNMYGYKLDIKNYFNSINVDILLDLLKDILSDDVPLFEFFKYLLTQDKAVFNDEVVFEKRGAMAGNPLSAFFADVYLMNLDRYFYNNHIVYARYADDMIMFCEDEQKLNKNIEYIKNFLTQNFLEINKDKEFYYKPNEKWSFLGFSYINKHIDVSDVTQAKIKGKIRRKAKKFLRWKEKKNVQNECAMRAYIRVFNRKFYNDFYKDEINWSRWFFPVINVSTGLKVIDDYFIQYIRYVATGKFSKKNYNIRYEDIKALGFRPLVNEFYKFKKRKIEE